MKLLLPIFLLLSLATAKLSAEDWGDINVNINVTADNHDSHDNSGRDSHDSGSRDNDHDHSSTSSGDRR